MIKLVDILKEIKIEQKRALRIVTNHTRKSLSISEIINSNALSKNETYALQTFFEFYNNGNIPLLNENTIKLIDKKVLALNENSLNEGWTDWVGKVGKKAVDWLKSGWENVKKIWKNFTDVIKQIIDTVKTGLQKVAASVWEKVKGINSSLKKSFDKNADKAKEHLDKHTPNTINKEWSTIKSAISHLASYSKSLVTGAEWEGSVLSGNVKPAGDTGPIGENINLPNLKFDKKLIESLLNLNESFHLEDLLNKEKHPTVFKVVKWTLKLISWVFNPINTALKYLAKYIVSGWSKDGKSGILYWINLLAEKLNGPAAIAYPILGFLCMELTETAMSGLNLASSGKMLGALNVGIEAVDNLGINIWETLHHLIEMVPFLSTVVFIVEWICIIYALGNFILNVFPEIIKRINPDISLAH
jgi:hypothetical protein